MDNVTEAKKRIPFVWFMYTVFIAVIYLSGELLMDFTPILDVVGDKAAWVMTILTTYVIGFPVLALSLKKAPAEMPPRNKMSFGEIIAASLMTLTVSLTVSAIGAPIIRLLNSATGSSLASGGAESAIKGSSLVWMIAVAVIIGPIFEELALRKLLIDRFYKYGEAAAIVASGVAFSLFHQSTSQLFYTVAMGMALAYVYIRTGNILYTITIHILCNCVSGLMMRSIDLNAIASAATLPEAEQMTVLMPAMITLSVMLVLWIIGLILLIVNIKKKKFHLNTAPAQLPKGKGLLIFLNIGFAAYLILSIVLMII